MGDSLRTLDCAGLSVREINVRLKEIAQTMPDAGVVLLNPDSRHNLAVGLTEPISLQIEGPVGYYCAGLCDGVDVRIAGGAGWGLAENLMGGRVHLKGSAGSAAGATLRGGLLVVEGDAGARCAVAQKGGTILVTGDVGYMTGFMMQKGVLIIGGDAGEALGDSMYEGRIYLRGRAAALGSDAVEKDLTDDDAALLTQVFTEAGVALAPSEFRKIVSGKRLYNFDKKEKEIWKTAL